MTRYGYNLECRYKGIPHDMRIIGQTKHVKWEVCQICGMKKKYNKGYKGRVKNEEYLKDHIRNFCQRNGATKRVYMRVYRPKETMITL